MLITKLSALSALPTIGVGAKILTQLQYGYFKRRMTRVKVKQVTEITT